MTTRPSYNQILSNRLVRFAAREGVAFTPEAIRILVQIRGPHAVFWNAKERAEKNGSNLFTADDIIAALKEISEAERDW